MNKQVKRIIVDTIGYVVLFIMVGLAVSFYYKTMKAEVGKHQIETVPDGQGTN